MNCCERCGTEYDEGVVVRVGPSFPLAAELLADIASRRLCFPCRIGLGASPNVPDVDYCFDCGYDGAALEAENEALKALLRAWWADPDSPPAGIPALIEERL